MTSGRGLALDTGHGSESEGWQIILIVVQSPHQRPCEGDWDDRCFGTNEEPSTPRHSWAPCMGIWSRGWPVVHGIPGTWLPETLYENSCERGWATSIARILPGVVVGNNQCYPHTYPPTCKKSTVAPAAMDCMETQPYDLDPSEDPRKGLILRF